MSNLTWSTGLTTPSRLAISGIYGYFGSSSLGRITQILMADGSIVNTNWSTGLTTPVAPVISGLYMYAPSNTLGTITQILLANGSIVNATWVTGLTGLGAPVISGNYMYVPSTASGGSIIQILLATGAIVNLTWASGLGTLGAPVISGLYMYVVNRAVGNIIKILLADGSIVSTSWTTGLPLTVSGVAISGQYLYATNNITAGNIYQISLANGSVVDSNWQTGLFNPNGIAILDNYMYVSNLAGNVTGAGFISKLLVNIVCFKEDTRILVLQNNEEVYVPVQDLRKGSLVKTLKHGYVPIHMIGNSKIYNSGNMNERTTEQLYNCSRKQYPELMEDLVITGCHSILVDSLTDVQREKTIEIMERIFITDNKYRLMACVDEKAEPYKEAGIFTIWHFALEHDDYYMNYGIFANGLLVESCSKKNLEQLSKMTFIE